MGGRTGDLPDEVVAQVLVCGRHCCGVCLAEVCGSLANAAGGVVVGVAQISVWADGPASESEICCLAEIQGTSELD